MDNLLATSRVARAVADLAICGIGRSIPPVAVLSDHTDFEVELTAAAVGAAIGYASIDVDAHDLKASDLDPSAQAYGDIMGRVQRRSRPALIILDLSMRGPLRDDPEQVGILKGIAAISATTWDGSMHGGLVVVTDDDRNDVARALGEALGSHDWASFIPL